MQNAGHMIVHSNEELLILLQLPAAASCSSVVLGFSHPITSKGTAPTFASTLGWRLISQGLVTDSCGLGDAVDIGNGVASLVLHPTHVTEHLRRVAEVAAGPAALPLTGAISCVMHPFVMK